MINSDQNEQNNPEFTYTSTKNYFYLTNQKSNCFNSEYFDERNKNYEFLQNVGLIKKEDIEQNSYLRNGILSNSIDIKFEEIDEIALLNSAMKSGSNRFQAVEEQNKTNAFIMQQILNRNDEFINSLNKEKSRKSNILSTSASLQSSSLKGKSTAILDETNHEKDLDSLLKLSKKYYCEICEEQFDLKRDFKVHQLYHSGKHPYTCEICFKKFMKLGDLNKHKQLHTGKQYICDQCDKGFTSIYSLAQHEKIHTGLKTHVCTVCNKSFLMKGQLLQHSLTHTNIRPYSCFICDKRFLQMSHLKQHKLTHTGVKTFSCQFCAKSFLQKSHLTQHHKTHTGDKEYECEICSKKFTQKGQLSKHKNVHSISDSSAFSNSVKSTQWTIDKLLN